jgi:hypothetical protein
MSALRGLLALFLVGCIHTNDDPPSFPSHPGEFDIPSPTPAAPTQASDDFPAPAPRLRHTKTLGQGDPVYERSSVAAPGVAPSQPGTTVIVNNNVQQTTSTMIVTPYGVPGLYVPPVGGSRGTSTSRGGSGTAAGRGGTPPVGGDWPQVPSYGPR